MLETILIILGLMAIALMGFWLLMLFTIIKVAREYDQDMAYLRDALPKRKEN